MDSVTEYGSQFDEGLRSSKYPLPSSAICRGMRILVLRLATPNENSWMDAVSCLPVNLTSEKRGTFYEESNYVM